ncbi:MAG: 3-dehydroquinate synthase [Candidatus Aminicenantes bacterium]|nr:MAG: 3-dehydroquinate synthase [Candidatus Aminicenantes bacterium]
MKLYEIHVSNGNCQVIIGESIKNLKNYLKSEKNVVITDKNVRHFYEHCFSDFEVIEIGLGEQIKNLETVEEIYQKLLEMEMDRSSFVIGIGGGIVCDVAGFSASTYMRGLGFGFVPSTLLAQVDASIGGKNGVNFKGYKNIIGVFNQPQFVLCDIDLLHTLPEKELLCGMAEVVKHALIKNPSYFHYLEQEWSSLLSLKPKTVEKVVDDSIKIKSEIVQEDALESGERRKLNFGHTLGHAIEKECQLPHGEAISIGMVIASRISVAKGMLSPEDADRIETLLQNLKLPTQLPPDKDLLIDAIKKDKKREGEDIHFVLLAGIGKAEVIKISYEELEDQINDLC